MQTQLRIPSYLSYSALEQFEGDRDEYFLRYLAQQRPERAPQGHPASVGSSFDAYVKAHLYEYFYGAGYMPEKYSFDALFTKQVEEQNRDFAKPAGKYVFHCYKLSGMLQRFIDAFSEAIEPPQFEFRVEAEIQGVTLLGLPDGYARLKGGISLVGDWKINGFCSKKSAISPNKGYLKCLDGYRADKQSRSHDKTHKDAVPMEHGGLEISAQYMEDYNEKWAAQTAGYAWCLGEQVGSEEFVSLIHQGVAKPLPSGDYPLMRFSEYRGRIRKPFQELLLRRYQKVQAALASGHIYDDRSKADSDERCDQMQGVSAAIANDDGPDADFFNSVVRPDWRG